MQVPLAFEFQANQTFESYFAGQNAEVVAQLHELAADGSEQQVFVWGDAGCGKTHLLQACCQLAKLNNKEPFYFKFNQQLPVPTMLEGLEEIDLVVFDDIQYLAGNNDWELALFAFYNSHRQNGHKLLLAADCPPKFLPIVLPDLKTRMSWGLTLKIQRLNDQEILEALQVKALNLGFELSPLVGRFLLNHYVHDFPALWQLLEKIDRATLAAQRKLTIPFLKQILADESKTSES